MTIADTINTVYRDFVTAGLPSSGVNEPLKSEIRALLHEIAIAIEAGEFDEPPTWAEDLATMLANLETVEAAQADLAAFQATLTAAIAEVEADASQTGLDRIQTGLDRVAVAAAAAAAAADRISAQAAALSAGGSAGQASTAASQASAAAAALSVLVGTAGFFNTKAAATAALGSIAANAYVLVAVDESQSGKRIIYQKQSGALVSVLDLTTLNASSRLDFTGPYPSDVWMTVAALDADNSTFQFNRSATINPGNAGRPNEVLNFGHNLNPGGGVVTSGKGLFGMGFEGHYEPNPGEAYWEWHIYAAFEDDGVQRRPDSLRLDKNSDLAFGWGRLMRHTLLTYTEPKKDTPYMQAQPAGFTWLGFNNEDTGEPEEGFSLVCDGSGGAGAPVIFSRVGATARALSLTTWNDIILPFGWTFQSPGQLFMSAGSGQGVIGLTDTDTDASLVIRHQRDIKIGRYGGNDLVWLDNQNDRVGLGAVSEAPRYKTHIIGAVGLTLPSSVTPTTNGDLVVEATSDTTLTFKFKGSDGVVRSGTLPLA